MRVFIILVQNLNKLVDGGTKTYGEVDIATRFSWVKRVLARKVVFGYTR